MLVTVLIFLVILSVLVLIHEAGHYLTAKFFNIKVEEFGFGIPPRAFGKKIGETIYSINWLPIGGFVKLYGEDPAGGGSVKLDKSELPTKDIGRTFYARPIWQRFIVVFAGVFMNFVLAVALVSILFSVVGVGVPGDKVIVDALVKNAPAQMAGLTVGDRIVSINGIKVSSPSEIIAITKKHLGQEVTLQIINAKSQTSEVKLTPRKDYPKNEGPMGIAISQNIVTKKYPWYQAPFVGTKEVAGQSLLIVEGLGRVVTQLITKGAVPSDVAGPVGIAQLTGVVCKDWAPCLSLTALLSLNLALINVLPIPALDGGRLMFIIIEAITRKKVSPKYETAAHTIGMVLLLGLIALITLHDLARVFSGQPILPQIK